MLKVIAPLAVLVLLVSAQPAHAQTMDIQGADKQQSPKELLEGATRMMMHALELMIKAVPQYEAPEILPNGDIILRRKQTDPDALPPIGEPDAKDKNPNQDRI